MPRRGPLGRLATALRDRFHERRAELFMELMEPGPGTRLLDLGSGRGDPFAARLARRADLEVTLADPGPGPLEDAPRHGFHGVRITPGAHLPFDDHAFDVVLSNSVIEHATGPLEPAGGTPLSEREWRRRAREYQRFFAREVRRVGRGYFVQTPHPGFPMDLHLWLPFTHRLPHPTLVRLAALTDHFWIKRTGRVDWSLVPPQDLKELFPEARIRVERSLGLPKSTIAWRRPEEG